MWQINSPAADGSSPHVSAIIPTHNRKAWLALALASALRQEAVRVQVVVFDDASTDGTDEFLSSLDDPRVTVLRADRTVGLVAARNAALEAASAPWVAFLDDDDLWAPGKCDALIASCERLDADWACSAAAHVDVGLRLLSVRQAPAPGEAFTRLLERNIVAGGGSGVLARTDVVRDVGNFRSHVGVEDWDLWIRLARRSPLATVNRPLVAYRVSAGSVSTRASHFVDDHRRLVAEWSAVADEQGVRVDQAGLSRYEAWQRLRSGERVPAARAWLRAGRPGNRPRDLGLAAAMVASPRWIVRRSASQDLAATPPSLLAEAESWISRYRSSHLAPAPASVVAGPP
jgi:GT2 family glycosyltransferase